MRVSLSTLHPDLTDAATLGCLVGLLREVSGYAGAHTEWCPETGEWHAWWRVDAPDDAPTEGAALWAALDAAWAMRGGA